MISHGITIGKDIIIGAGSTVIDSIPDTGVYVGSFARLLNER